MMWRLIRWMLALIVGLYFIANAVLAKALIDFKLNGVRPDAASHFWAPVLADMGGVQSAIWLVGVMLYGVSAVMLALGRRGAVYAYGVAVACDFANWRMMMTHPSYTAVFGPGQAEKDTAIFVVLLIFGGVVWVVDRRADWRPRR
jgi:hypothetical protein